MESDENGVFDHSTGTPAENIEALDNMAEGNQLSTLVEWLNEMIPHIHLPFEASEEKLRACLVDGTVLCLVLNKLSPDSVEMGANFEPGPANVKRFLAAMDDMGLPRFELSDLEQILGWDAALQETFIKDLLCQTLENGDTYFNNHTNSSRRMHCCLLNMYYILRVGNMAPVLQCLRSLRASFSFCDEEDTIQDHSRKRWNVSRLDKFPATEREERQCNSLDRKFQHSLHGTATSEESALMHHLAHTFHDVLHLKEGGYTDVSDVKILEFVNSSCVDQNNLFRAREEKYKSRIRVLETLTVGTTEENQVVANQLERIKTEKTNIEQKEKLEEQNALRLKKENDDRDIENSTLKQDLELAKRTHELHCLQLEEQIYETKIESQKKLQELERLLTVSKKKVEELESLSESKSQRWKRIEHSYQSFMGCQLGVIQDLRVAFESTKHEVLETKKNYSKEFDCLGLNLKRLIDAAEKYHVILAENRRLYNEVQDLKGNIRVYCRIRPFLPGQSKKQTTIEYIGENGELVVSNPLKQGKDNHRLFKFNKVFGPEASQGQEVFLDTRPLIRSVLDGFKDFYVSLDLHTLGIWNATLPNGLAVPEASMYSVQSTADVLELMNIGLMNRAVCSTALNERSSRSHSILTIHVRGTDLKNGAILRGSLHLIDLAGSERVDRSEATGDRLREAQHINKSLSALGDVIFALAQKNPHVPYRNSKLTQVLQSSLGGQAKTLMMVQLNPDVDSYSETISTLKFAERVSGVELGAARSNKEGSDVRELMEQVGSLKDIITKKDEEIERLQVLKANISGVRHRVRSLSHGRSSSSPRRRSVASPRASQRSPVGKGPGHSDKAASNMDNCSDYSDKRSEAGSLHSLEDIRHQKECLLPSKVSTGDLSQSLTEDFVLLGFGDEVSEERLSDISDGGLTMGTETDGSTSVVEFTLFPEPSKPTEKSDNTKKPSLPSKHPKPAPQKPVPKNSSRFSLTKGTSKTPSSSRKPVAGSSSSTKNPRGWH
ncbi:kinesin-like protein KIN-14J [Citrus sinensis]|uniref:Kinesin-like protein KIN-14J n=1 Tax=Citrus sinensis TaxID=2711 RepID=A0ACB8LQQ5_CITSI|nr:kinesin-like protein KIN-14J [Citrus sinensis]